MFKIFENAWTEQELDWFRHDMQKTKLTTKIHDDDDIAYKDAGRIRWGCEENTVARDRLQKKISELLPNHNINFAAYVEQHKPSLLHCDAYGGPFGVSCVIPLSKEYNSDTDQTLVFDYLSAEKETIKSIIEKLKLRKLLKNKEKNARFKVNPAELQSEKYETTHYTTLVHQLKLLGVFPYRYGNMVAFDKRLLHGSNDWNKTDPKRQHKDFILVQTFEGEVDTSLYSHQC